ISNHEVINEDMTIAFIHIRSRGRVPAEVVSHRAAFAAAHAGSAVDEGIIVHLRVTAVENMDSQLTVDKHVTHTE
ncbi:MAG TPA: hypothetical protein DIS74_01915, partial [Bacteroidales bacterium]|nr:hypothetical protein [Bacteroidales bacterium]